MRRSRGRRKGEGMDGILRIWDLRRKRERKGEEERRGKGVI